MSYPDIEIEVFGTEIDAIFYKDGKVYLYPVGEIEELLDRLMPDWRLSVYSQEMEYV